MQTFEEYTLDKMINETASLLYEVYKLDEDMAGTGAKWGANIGAGIGGLAGGALGGVAGGVGQALRGAGQGLGAGLYRGVQQAYRGFQGKANDPVLGVKDAADYLKKAVGNLQGKETQPIMANLQKIMAYLDKYVQQRQTQPIGTQSQKQASPQVGPPPGWTDNQSGNSASPSPPPPPPPPRGSSGWFNPGPAWGS